MEKIKQILRKLLFLDEHAKGAVFGLTGVLAMPWLVFTIWIFLLFYNHSSILSIGLYFYGSVILIIGFFVFSKFWFIRIVALDSMLPKDTFFIRRNFHGLLVLCVFAICIALGCMDAVLEQMDLGVSIPLLLALYFFIDFTILSGARSVEWFAMSILLLLGLTGFCMMFVYGILPFEIVIDKLSDGPLPIVQYHYYFIWEPLRDAMHYLGVNWFWLAFASFLCILLFYLLQVRIIARAAKLPARSLFGKRTTCLLALCAAIYAVCLPCASFEQFRYRRTMGELETHFGRSLDVKELERLYYDGAQPDSDFWKKLKDASYSWSGHWKGVIFPNDEYAHYHFPFSNNLFWSEWEKEPYEKWRAFCMDNPENATLDALLEGNIPPAPREYREGQLLYDPWSFKDWDVLDDCCYLLMWRLRFAVEARDMSAVSLIFDKLERICEFQKTDRLVSLWVLESLRMKAMMYVIEGGMADDAWLDRQSESLERLEQELAALEQREMYYHAVVFKSMEHSLAHCLDREGLGAELSPLRWFFPQAWWMAARDANAYAIRFLNDSPDEESKEVWQPWFKNDMRRVPKTSRRFLVLIRGGRALLEAERIRRRTGRYPSTMENLPLDPFTEMPLQYSVGPCEITADVVKVAPPEECDDSEPDYDCQCGCDCSDGCQCSKESNQMRVDMQCKTLTFDAVQIFSPGPKNDSKYDDIRLFIKVGPSNVTGSTE